ncbi:MAG: phosphotransferase family protein [Novosphingobium sp.]
MSDIIVAPETRDLDELAGQLTAWLGLQMPEARELRLADFDYPRGAGMSHETILFEVRWSADGEQRKQGMVVRIKPETQTVFPDNLFDEQYQLMKLLHEGNYVRVAKVLWLEQDTSILGRPFFVMERMYGRVPVSNPPYALNGWVADATPDQHRKIWEEGVTQLARIQLVPRDKLDFLLGPPHAREGFAQEWDKYVRFVEWVKDSPLSAVLRDALKRLESTFPVNRPEGLVWGDARIGNMMYDENFEVIGVMDWEQPSLGGALQDLAWFLVLSETMHGPSAVRGKYLPGMGSREETIALWEQISGKSATDIEWYEEFTHLKMACTGVRLGALRGEVMQDEATLRARLKV